MEAIPIPPPIPIAPTFVIPNPVIAEPQWIPPKWEPVPVYQEDIPDEPSVGPNESENKKEPEAKPPVKPIPPPQPPPPPPLPDIPELSEVQTITVPIIDAEIPVPRPEILVTAATTAGVSSVVAVGGTLVATTMFRQLQPILKPIFKFALKKVAKIRKKPPPVTWSRQRLLDRRSAAAAVKLPGLHQHKRGRKVKKDGL
jgi:hypothetical protein